MTHGALALPLAVPRARWRCCLAGDRGALDTCLLAA
jgi:hypothetical protein